MKHLRPVFVLAILCLFTGTAASQKLDLKLSRNNPEMLKAFRTVVAQPSEYTVRVQSDGKDAAFGTIIESNGYILTKASEVTGKITVKTKDGTSYDATVVGKNDDYDLVMLKVEASGLPIVEWRDSKAATVGKWVASPGTTENPVAIGVVSVAKRKLVGGDQPPKVALGPNTPSLGVRLEPGSSGGAKIADVVPGSAAFKAGLKPSDIVLELAGKQILDHEALINAIQRLKVNDSILLKIRRGDEELELKAKLGKIDQKMLGNPQEFMGGQLSKRRGQFPFILQHDTVLKPGDCGGPLVDLDGKTVGINIARAGRTETYAIPAEDVQKLLNDLKTGKVSAKVDPIDPKKDPDVLLRAAPNLTKKDLASKFRKGSFMKVHEVKLKAGATYVIEMESNELDAYLILEDSMGTKLSEDDDGAGFPNARIVFRAPVDGTFRVIATTFNPDETGNYTLTVRKEK